jgi:hypothetical protein
MALFSHPFTNVTPISPRSQNVDERFDAIDRRLDALSVELRELISVTHRIAERLDEAAP